MTLQQIDGRRFDSNLSFYVPPAPEGGGIASAQAVVRQMLERYGGAVGTDADRTEVVAKAVSAWRESIEREVGPDKWRRLHASSGALRGSTDLRPRLVDPRTIEAERARVRERSRELVEKVGVDTSAVRNINRRLHEQLAGKLKPAPTDGHELEVVRDHDVPSVVREGEGAPDPWFVKHPPFDGWWWRYSWWTSGGKLTAFRHNVEVLENPFTNITGQFGHYSRYENFSASDFDDLWLNVKSSVGFWYKAPQAGQKQVWVKVRAKRTRISVYLDDEFGWSSSTTNCWSRLHLNVAQVPGLEGQTANWEFHRKGSPDSSWYHFDLIAPDGIVWIPVTVQLPPDWVYIAVGAEDHRQTGLNDVSTDQSMDTQYVLEQVWIEK